MLVLVVDDEPVARMLHLSLLARMRDVSAVGAGSVSEARALIAEAPPQVVLLDMQLPDGNGLDVVAILEAQRVNAILVIITAYVDAWKDKLPAQKRIHVLGKPAPMRDLQQIIEQALHKEVQPGPFSPLDYVQLACMGHHSAVIECVTSTGRGEITVEKGQLWSAQDEQGNGIGAFNRLALLKGCHIRVLPERKWRGPRNLDG